MNLELEYISEVTHRTKDNVHDMSMCVYVVDLN
jgi:hypothetical protein